MRLIPQGSSVPFHRWRQLVFLLILMVLMLLPGRTCAQEQPSAATRIPSADALKYHEMLRRRPQTGMVFDRFMAAWLADGSRDSLREFLLKASNTASATAADHLILALYYSTSGQDTEALKACEKASLKAPDEPLIHLRTAEIANRLKDWDTALTALTRVSQLGLTGESNIRATRLHADTLWRLGRTAEAKDVFHKLIERHPDEHSLREELVDMLVENGLKPEAAIESRTLVDLTKDPFEKAMRRLRQADLLLDLRKMPQASTELDLTLAQSGTDSWLESEALDRIERLSRRSGDVPGVATKLAELAKQHPNRVAIVRRQMRILTEIGKPVDASALAAALLQRTPGRQDVREDYINLLESQGNIREAVLQCEELLHQQPGDGALMLRLAGLHGRNGSPERTRALIDQFLKQSPDDEGALLQSGRLLERLALDDAAHDLYEKWMSSHPQNPLAGLSLAALLHRKGDVPKAIALWRKLAAQGDLSVASQVAAAASNRGEDLAAFEILKAREQEFTDDLRMLTQACNVAVRAQQESSCVRWMRRYAQLVKDPSELQRLATLTGAMLNRQSIRKLLLDDYAKTPASGITDGLLLAFAHEFTTPENAYDERQSGARSADELLTQAWKALPHPADAPLSMEETLVEAGHTHVLIRRRDWSALLRILSENAQRPGGKTSTRLQDLAQTSAEAFEYDAAMRWIVEWKATAPTSHTPWRLQARLLRSTGQPTKVIEVLREAARRFPDQEDITFQLADALSVAGHAGEALAAIRELFDQKDDPSQRLRIGAQMVRMAKKANQLDLLLDEWKRNQREHADTPEAWRLLAMAYREKPDVTAYCNALAEALRLAPKDISIMHELAMGEDMRGNTGKALELHRQASRHESSPQARRSYIDFLLKRGEAEEALVLMQEIASAQTTTPADLEAMADQLMGLRLWGETAALLEIPAQNHFQNARIQYLRGVALEESGQLDKAALHFIRILQMQEEMVDAVPLPALRQAPLLPEVPGAQWWYRLREHGPLAYNYREWADWNVKLPLASRSGSWVVWLPKSREEAQVLALRHLGRLGELSRMHSPPGRRISLPAEIPMASLWTQLTVARPSGRTQWYATTEQVREHPLLLADWLRSQLNIIDLPPEGSPALWALAEQTFAESHPVLAAEAAMLQAFTCAPDQRTSHLERSLKFSQRAKGDRVRLASLTAALAGDLGVYMMPGLERRTPLGQQDESRLVGALSAWAREEAATDDRAGNILASAASTLATLGHWEEWRDLLDEVVPQIRENAAARTLQAESHEVGNVTHQLLAFPCMFYSGYGIFPKLCLPQNSEWGRSNTAVPAPATLPEGARDPLVKLLCLHAAGRITDLKQEAARLANAHPDREDLVYLKASVLALDGESDELTKTLRQWATMPANDAVNRSRAQHIVGLSVGARLPADEAMQSAMTTAVKHLMTVGSLEDVRKTPEALKAAGFAIQAQMLASAVIRDMYDPSPATKRATKPFNVGAAQQLMARVDAISDGGAALRLLTETLRPYAADEIALMRGYSRMRTDDGWRWLLQTLYRKPTFHESVEIHLTSEAGSPRLKHEEAAFILSEIGTSWEAAREQYQKALERNPGNARVRLRAVCLSIDDDPAKAQQIYMAAPVEDRCFIGESLCNDPQGRNPMLTQILAKFAEGLLRDAAGRKESPVDLDWLLRVTTSLAWTGHAVNSPGISELLQAEAPVAGAGFGSTTTTEEENRRDGYYYLDKQFESLAEAAMTVPAFAAPAFTSYAGFKLKHGATVESLAPKARGVLQLNARAGTKNFLLGLSHRIAPEPRYVWQPTPLMLLALHAFQQPDPHASFTELASFARGLNIQDSARLIANLERLYTCKESDFSKAAQDFAATSSETCTMLDLFPATVVARIWKQRGLKLDPTPLVLPDISKAQSYYTSLNGVGVVLKTLAERGEREKARVLLIKVMEASMGPRAQWTDFVTRYGPAPRHPGPVALRSVHTLMNDLGETEPMLVFLSLELAEEAGLRVHTAYGMQEIAPSWLPKKNQYGETPVHSHDAVMNFLAGSPWLKPDSSLWDCPLNGTDKTTLLGQVAVAVRMLNKDQQVGVRATLEHAATHNPGAALILALVEQDQQKLVDALAHVNGNIATAPDRVAEALGFILETELSPHMKPAAQTRAPDVFAALKRAEAIQATRNAEAFFTARIMERLQMSDAQFEETMSRAATHLASTDRAKAVRLLDRACELIADRQARLGFNGQTTCSEALKRWCDKTQNLDVVAVACDLFHQPDEFNAVSAGWWNSPSWGGALMTAWKDGGGIGNPAAGLKSMLESLHSKLAIKKAPLLILAFMDFHGKLDAWQQQEVLKAADSLAKEQTDISLYASWLGLAFRLSNLADGALWLPGSQPPEIIRDVMDGFRAIIKDESVNPLVRLAVAHNLMNKAGRHADPETIWGAMDLATLAVEKEWLAQDYLMLDILNAVNRLPVDEGYKAAATRWLPAWLHRNRLTAGSSGGGGQSYEPLEAYQSAVLTFAARGLNSPMLRQTLRSLSGLQQRSSANLLTLIRYQRDDVAREFFLQSKDMLLRASHNKLQPEESDMEKVHAFAETLPNPDQRVQVMVYCSSFYGQGMLPDQWADSRALSWNRRMAEQAHRVMEHTFQDAALKDKLMLELADAPAAVMVMEQDLKEKDLREMTRHASFGSGPGSIAETLRYPLELTLNSLVKRIRETSPEALAAAGSIFPGPYPSPLNEAQLDYQTLLERIDSGRESRGKWECMRQTEGNLFESTMLSAPSMSGTSLAGFLPAWHKVLRAYADEKERFEEEALGIATQIVLAGLSGKTAEVQAWREDVSHYRRDSLKAQFIAKRHLMPVAQQLCRLEGGKWRGFDERWKLVQAFAEDPWVAEYLKSSRDIITQLVRNRVLTIEEALEHAKELAAMFPTEGRVAAELATLMQIHHREDEMVALLTLATEQANGLEAWDAEWTLRLVKWKEHHQLRDEAMKLWEDLKNRAKLPPVKLAIEAAKPSA